jgi:outer membrane lipoprotein SlyB
MAVQSRPTQHRYGTIVLIAVSLALTACAGSQSGSAYSRGQTRGEMLVRMGVVESVRTVQIEGTRTGVGTSSGAIIGGVAGSGLGGHRSSAVGTVLGAVIGGVAGQAIEESANRKPGLEITIRLDNGQLIAVTQEADENFQNGERVRVLSGQGVTRVAH